MTEPNQDNPKPETNEPKPYTRSEQMLFAIGGRIVLGFVLLLGLASVVAMGWIIVSVVRRLWFGQ